MLLAGIQCENDAWNFDLIRLAIGDAVETIGTEDVLYRVQDTIEQSGDEVLATIDSVVLTIARVDGDDANSWITLRVCTSDSCFC